MNIRKKIEEIKQKKNATIIAHFYQPDEIQEIADFVGDSLEMSRYARDNRADVIVFCGVDFMAGSAKLLSPHKTVLLPVADATCPMADMVIPADVIRLRKQHPNAAVVTYINSTVAVKAVSDICCTSSNAIKVVNSLPEEEIIFLPDKNLGSYVAKFTDKKIILWDGHCCVHNNLTFELALKAKSEHPNAVFVVHPECISEVAEIADFVGSTSKIIEFIKQSERKEFIVGTEEGILYRLKKDNPDKVFHMAYNDMVCKNMKKIDLEAVLNSLELGINEIELDEDTMENASKPLKRMMEI